MDVRLGPNDFKIEKCFPLLLVICQAHSLPSTEFISATNIAIAPYRTKGVDAMEPSRKNCNWLDPIWPTL